MWQESIDKNIAYIEKQDAVLQEFEKVCQNIYGMISNLSSDVEVLDIRQLDNVDYSRLLELSFPPDIQVI